MFIRFICPLCKKGLKVKQELAGKRVKCAACQKPVQVPAAPPSAATPAHAEELAAQVFADAPKPVEEKKLAGGPITLNCYYCDEEVTFAAELAGKQASCPSCRRIVKVPLPVKEAPKDWRTVQHSGPSAAKQSIEPAPEGMWSASAKSTVSQEALIEADVLVEEVEPLSRQEKVRRGILAIGGIVVLGAAVWGTLQLISASKQDSAFQKALKFVENEAKISPEIAAEVHRLAGEYFLRAGERDQANAEFKKARGSLARARPGLEHEAALIDLALSQIDLGGSKSQSQDRARLKWEDAQTELRQTLQKLGAFDARAEGIRLVARKLAARSQESAEARQELRGRAEALARLVSGAPPELPELLSIVGLEIMKIDAKHAEEIAADAAKMYAAPPAKAPDKKGDKPPAVPKLPVAPSLLALLLALKQDGKAAEIQPPVPPNVPSIVGEVRFGYAVGCAHQAKWDLAFAYCRIGGDPNQRLQTLVAVAEVALDKSPEEAKRFLTAALEICEREKPGNAPWAVRQLAYLAARAGLADKVPVVLDKFLPNLKNEAHLYLLRGRPGNDVAADMNALTAEAAKKTQASERLLSFLARRIGTSAAKAAADWEPEPLRALAYIGAAVGMQDSSLGTQAVVQKR